MSELTDFLVQLGIDAKLAAAYERNPQQVMADAGLSDAEIRMLLDGDLQELEQATGLGSIQKYKIVIRAISGGDTMRPLMAANTVASELAAGRSE